MPEIGVEQLRPHTDYRICELSWLGSIPSHWDIRRNGRLFVQRNETGYPDLPILEVSLRTGVRVRDFDNAVRKQVMSDKDKYKRARASDIAYNMMRMWQGAVGVVPVDGLVSPAYVVAKPFPETCSRYYEYLFRTAAYMNEVNKFSRGIVSDRNRLYWEDFKQIPSLFPPPEEQVVIVRFLDYIDRRVKRYIRAKRKLIALLNEQKQAIIHRAVTRGLDPNVRLKPSGVPWLGDVPEHWEAPLNQRIFKEKIRPHCGAEEQQLSLSQRSGLIATSEMEERSLQTSTYDNWKVTVPGDLVVNRFKAHLGVFFAATLRGIVSFHYGVFAPQTKLVTKYFELLFHTNPYKTIYAGRSNGMTIGLQNLSNQNFYNVRSIVPPLSEQNEIVKFADGVSRTANNSCRVIQRDIDLMIEYRTRLIADAVTGKLDVREATAAFPDEPESSEPEVEEQLDDEATGGEEDVELSEIDIANEDVEA